MIGKTYGNLKTSAQPTGKVPAVKTRTRTGGADRLGNDYPSNDHQTRSPEPKEGKNLRALLSMDL